MTALLDVDAALAHLLAGVAALPGENVTLDLALGRVIAGDVAALLTQPPFAASAMDGYAIRWADMPGPWTIVGEAVAGRRWSGQVEPGQAVRIFTGAPLPAGADTIVVQEEIVREGDLARLAGAGPPGAGAHVRRAGQDFGAGTRSAIAGDHCTPARLGLLAAAGHGQVAVVRRPRVTLIATGDELVAPGVAPGPDQIVSANGVMLRGLFEATGAIVETPGIVPDRTPELAAALALATVRSEVIVTIGGASVGDHDLVVPVLRGLGADIDFWKVAMRPGKPMLAGMLAGRRVIGLPGNPVSAFVCALLFVVPLLRRLGGRSESLASRGFPLAGPLAANGERRDHLRGRVKPDGTVEAFGPQDSALLARLAAADVLIVRMPSAAAASAGEIVHCILLDRFADVA